MLFKDIGIIDENFNYKPGMFVGTGSGRIEYIGSEMPECADEFGDPYDGRDKVLMSGFFNAHAHSPMCLMRGYGENMALRDWLNKKIFPFEEKLYREAVYWSTLLTMAESLRFGIVSTSDMYYFIDDMVDAYKTSGVKANVSRAVVNPMGLPIDEVEGLREMREAIRMYNGAEGGRIIAESSVHAEYTNNLDTIKAVAETAAEYGTSVHIHLSETKDEHQQCIEKYGKTPAEVMSETGVFDVPAIAAHCVWVSESDIDILKEKNVSVASNPASNFKLASGICDVPGLYAKGINVALGTDSVASNNSLNFIEQIKLFALAGKIKSNDPAAMTPEQVLCSATRAGAVAQRRMDCGLIKEGFKADITVLDVSGPNMHPVYDMAHNIIYSADGKDVCLTMVDGRICYKDGEYKTIDIEKTIFEATKARDRILAEL